MSSSLGETEIPRESRDYRTEPGKNGRRYHVLHYVMEHWTKISDDGNDVDIIYLDFRKAFDCVPHQRLL